MDEKQTKRAISTDKMIDYPPAKSHHRLIKCENTYGPCFLQSTLKVCGHVFKLNDFCSGERRMVTLEMNFSAEKNVPLMEMNKA